MSEPDNEMIERVARAICDAITGATKSWDIAAAKAAIEAMREPTREMVEAFDAGYAQGFAVIGVGNPVREGLDAMIDAALGKEKP